MAAGSIGNPFDPSRPSPEASPTSYTPAQVQKRLEYANRLGQRNLDPRSEIFLQLYREAATNAPVAADEGDRLSYCSQLYRYDKFLQANSYIGKEPATQQKALEENLLKLKRHEYYVRYGEYMGRELALFEETDGDPELRQYWTPINEKTREERKLFEKQRGETDCDPIDTLLDIWDVAYEVKLPTERVEWVIEQYAENNLAQYSITKLLQLGRWGQLADLLYNDSKDLAVTIPPRMEQDIETMSAVIRCIKEEFFTVEEGDEDFPAAWRANDEAAKYRKQLRAKTEGKERTKTELVEKMVERANEAAKKREKQTELVEEAISRKRKTSQEFPLGEAILAKKTKEMEKIVGIQKQVYIKEEELERLYQKRDKAVDDLGNLDIEEDG